MQRNCRLVQPAFKNDNHMWCLLVSKDHFVYCQARKLASRISQDNNKIFADEIVPIFMKVGTFSKEECLSASQENDNAI